MSAPAHALPATAGQQVLAFAEAVVFAMARLLWAVVIVLLVLVGGPEPWS